MLLTRWKIILPSIILIGKGNFFTDTSCRSRLAQLNEKLTQLERRVEYIEARVWHVLFYLFRVCMSQENLERTSSLQNSQQT